MGVERVKNFNCWGFNLSAVSSSLSLAPLRNACSVCCLFFVLLAGCCVCLCVERMKRFNLECFILPVLSSPFFFYLFEMLVYIVLFGDAGALGCGVSVARVSRKSN